MKRPDSGTSCSGSVPLALHFGQDIFMVTMLRMGISVTSTTLFSKTFVLCHQHSQFIHEKTAQNINKLRYSAGSFQFIEGALCHLTVTLNIFRW